MKFYLAYGSNLSVRQMLQRCPGAVYVGTAKLKGWRLLFRKSQSGNYLTIEQRKRRTVPALVWRVSEADEQVLDWYEGYPRFYRKEEVSVILHSLVDGSAAGTVDAFAYVMDEHRPLGMPSAHYYNVCLEGYRHFGFDESVLKRAVRESAWRRLRAAGE